MPIFHQGVSTCTVLHGHGDCSIMGITKTWRYHYKLTRLDELVIPALGIHNMILAMGG